jgi:hypothetical protein
LGFEDLGPEGPFYSAEKKEHFPSLGLERPAEPQLVRTDVNTPHLNLYDLELIKAAGLDPLEMWDPKLSAQAFLSCSLILLAYAGNTRSLVNLNAVGLTMEYTATGTFTDVIIYTLVYPPVETIQSSQVSCTRSVHACLGAEAGDGRHEIADCSHVPRCHPVLSSLMLFHPYPHAAVFYRSHRVSPKVDKTAVSVS